MDITGEDRWSMSISATKAKQLCQWMFTHNLVKAKVCSLYLEFGADERQVGKPNSLLYFSGILVDKWLSEQFCCAGTKQNLLL